MIHTRGLSRRFKVKNGPTVDAVRDLDIDVAEGELVAFLGPNGAGKSTSLRMLTTLLPASAGTAIVAGCDVVGDPTGVRRKIGYLGQGKSAGDDQLVRDELVTQGRCYGMSRAESKKRCDELLEALDLVELAKRTPYTLSGGQRRRLDVAMALVHRPQLLFLDEPSTGLDPHSRANLWEHILRLRADHGTTIFMTTHYLEEADSMAERVMVIDHGKVIADDNAENLKSNLAGDRITITTGDAAEAERAAHIAGGIPTAHEVSVDTTMVSMRVTRGHAVLPEFLRILDNTEVKVLTAEVVRPTLDDVFLSLTGRSLRESVQ